MDDWYDHPMQELPKHLDETYKYICAYWLENYTSPTMVQIASRFNLASTSTVHKRIHKLERAGLLVTRGRRGVVPVGAKFASKNVLGVR